MKYFKLITSACFSAMLLHCLIKVPDVAAQGVGDQCLCWQKLAQVIGKQTKPELDGGKPALWMTQPIYNLLGFESTDEERPRLSLSAEGQPEVNAHHGRQSALTKLLLRRSTRSKVFTENSLLYCNVCWALLRDLSSSKQTPKSLDTFATFSLYRSRLIFDRSKQIPETLIFEKFYYFLSFFRFFFWWHQQKSHDEQWVVITQTFYSCNDVSRTKSVGVRVQASQHSLTIRF
ncbi:hypothetical protein PoB_004781200 [Plakobranchus ocellatus]|uniref:Uncharacterized protein n=1 Tax=Plakobranchus ocellatus TaxID=259542 RepID=A0AAV4BPK5_9GAST|nr:hypothetical protein PoB_004781200 [Plakobranchus ocellatus]